MNHSNFKSRVVGIFAVALMGLTATVQFAMAAPAFVQVPPYDMNQYNQDIISIYKDKSSHAPELFTRLDDESAAFLNKPYLLYSNGEGVHGIYDQNPLYRTDGFDCFTYVSTVLALVENEDLNGFQNSVRAINYRDNTPSFLTRNHFTSVDWNRKNQQNGFIEDVTASLFPKYYKVSDTLIDKPHWFAAMNEDRIQLLTNPGEARIQALLNDLKQKGQIFSPVESHLNYLPLSALFDAKGKAKQALFDKIPSGSVIEIVRPNWDLTKQIGTHLDVSHMGLAIRKKGILYYREASSLDKKVEDVPMADYLAGYLDSKTVKGINIEKIKLKEKR